MLIHPANAKFGIVFIDVGISKLVYKLSSKYKLNEEDVLLGRPYDSSNAILSHDSTLPIWISVILPQ